MQNRPRFMSSGANHAVVSEKTKQQHSLYIHSYSMSECRSAVVILMDKNWNGIHSFCFRLQQTCQFDATSSEDVPACDHQNQQGSCAFSVFHFPVISYIGGSLCRLGIACNYCMACISATWCRKEYFEAKRPFSSGVKDLSLLSSGVSCRIAQIFRYCQCSLLDTWHNFRILSTFLCATV